VLVGREQDMIEIRSWLHLGRWRFPTCLRSNEVILKAWSPKGRWLCVHFNQWPPLVNWSESEVKIFTTFRTYTVTFVGFLIRRDAERS
jgi:hypothetical protein